MEAIPQNLTSSRRGGGKDEKNQGILQVTFLSATDDPIVTIPGVGSYIDLEHLSYPNYWEEFPLDTVGSSSVSIVRADTRASLPNKDSFGNKISAKKEGAQTSWRYEGDSNWVFYILSNSTIKPHVFYNKKDNLLLYAPFSVLSIKNAWEDFVDWVIKEYQSSIYTKTTLPVFIKERLDLDAYYAEKYGFNAKPNTTTTTAPTITTTADDDDEDTGTEDTTQTTTGTEDTTQTTSGTADDDEDTGTNDATPTAASVATEEKSNAGLILAALAAAAMLLM